MGKILMVNGSPRAPRSNSRQYAALFAQVCPEETEYRNITAKNQEEILQSLESASDLLLVFPLYADGIPVPLLGFLKRLEAHPPRNRPVISVLINCGFLEPEQNDTAVEMVRLFCRQAGFPFGSVLKIGGGEAILSTPFRPLVKRKIRLLARAVAAGRCRVLQVTMPLPKRVFLLAANRYWTDRGRKNGLSPAELACPDIEK